MFKIPTAYDNGIGTSAIAADNTPTQQLATSDSMFGGGTEQLGDVANALASFTEKSVEIDNRIKSREEVVYRADARQKFTAFAEDRFNKFQTEGDFFDPNHLTKFNEDISNYGDQFTKSRGKGDKLWSAISDITHIYKNKALSSVNTQQRALVDDQIGKEIGNLVTKTSQDPGSLNDSFNDLNNIMQEYYPALRPDEQIAHIDAGRQQILLGVINSFINRGQYDDANELVVENPQVFSLLNLTEADRINQSIHDGMNEQQKEQQKMANMVAAVEHQSGRKLTPNERIEIMTGIDPDADPMDIGKQNAKVMGVEWDNLNPRDRYLLSKGEIPPEDEFNPDTDAGQIVNDRQELVNAYGEDSDQVILFDKLANKQSINFDPKSDTGKLVADRDQLLRRGLTVDSAEIQNLNRQISDSDPEYQKNQELIKSYKKTTLLMDKLSTQTEIVTSNARDALSIIYGVKVDENTDLPSLLRESYDTTATGTMGHLLQNLPIRTDATDLHSILDSIRAIIGFEYLQKMREAAPTGGALGNVSNIENKLLQSTSGSLDIKAPDALVKTLINVLENMPLLLQEKQEAYDKDYSAFIDQKDPTPQDNSATNIENMDINAIANIDVDSLDDDQLNALNNRLKVLGFE